MDNKSSGWQVLVFNLYSPGLKPGESLWGSTHIPSQVVD
ncbi:hypothetical protein S7335_1148 [Synechococcus sp. PCC 7335]|nr:hypothetical protein S7335_1148 [Synechococcus sp. PCC 7335]